MISSTKTTQQNENIKTFKLRLKKKITFCLCSFESMDKRRYYFLKKRLKHYDKQKYIHL